LAQFDDETVNLVAASDGVQGQVPDSKTFRLGVANAPTGPLRVNRVGLTYAGDFRSSPSFGHVAAPQ